METYNGQKTIWISCRGCGKGYEIYADESAIYDKATDIYTRRGTSPNGLLIEESDFPKF